MEQESNFERARFRVAPEGASEANEGAAEWGRPKLPRSRPLGGTRPRPPIRYRPPAVQHPASRRLTKVVFWDPPVDLPALEPGSPIAGSERVRWLQDCLNQVLHLHLPISGILGPETRSALRSFQRQRGLRVNGIAGPATEAALQAACHPASELPQGAERGWPPLLAHENDGGLAEEVTILRDTRVTIRRETALSLGQEPAWQRLDAYPSYAYVIQDTRRGRTIYVGETGSGARFSGRLRVFKELGLSLSDIPALSQRRVEVYTAAASALITSGSRSHAENLRKIAQTVLYLIHRPAVTDPNRLEDVCVAGGTLEIVLDGRRLFSIGRNQYLTAKGPEPGVRTGRHRKCGFPG